MLPSHTLTHPSHTLAHPSCTLAHPRAPTPRAPSRSPRAPSRSPRTPSRSPHIPLHALAPPLCSPTLPQISSHFLVLPHAPSHSPPPHPYTRQFYNPPHRTLPTLHLCRHVPDACRRITARCQVKATRVASQRRGKATRVASQRRGKATRVASQRRGKVNVVNRGAERKREHVSQDKSACMNK